MSEPLSSGPPSPLRSALLETEGTHAHCRHCRERVSVSTPVAVAGWHTVHACTPQDAIEVNVRSPGAEPWAWRYAADAVAASLVPPPSATRRRGSSA
jgi:hypothetical protein